MLYRIVSFNRGRVTLLRDSSQRNNLRIDGAEKEVTEILEAKDMR